MAPSPAMDAGKEIPMRKWLTLAAAAATLALTACSGTMPASSNSSNSSNSSSSSGSTGVEVFGTVDTGISRTW